MRDGELCESRRAAEEEEDVARDRVFGYESCMFDSLTDCELTHISVGGHRKEFELETEPDGGASVDEEEEDRWRERCVACRVGVGRCTDMCEESCASKYSRERIR